MKIRLNRKILVTILVVGYATLFFMLYQQSKQKEWRLCVSWLLRQENLGTMLTPGDRCYNEQRDARKYIKEYQPDVKEFN